ncbi:hypothetical protein GCK32_002517 [Trichostrongylus colubriformis]|uniref:Uncharacterized protein n=1 Tax=Trichostrongylus colubriformis TaxID=6319 RepID=A0AAN8IAY1_TRICO
MRVLFVLLLLISSMFAYPSSEDEFHRTVRVKRQFGMGYGGPWGMGGWGGGWGGGWRPRWGGGWGGRWGGGWGGGWGYPGAALYGR